MSQVSGSMKELSAIATELKILDTRTKELRKRRKILETEILKYLEETDGTGLRYRDLVVLRKESTVRLRRKKREKEDSAIQALEELGVDDAKAVYQTITKAVNGQKQVKSKLAVKIEVPEIT